MVQANNNIGLHQLAGSSITNHNGLYYSTFVNDNMRLKLNSDGSVNYGIVENGNLYEANGTPGGKFTQGTLIKSNYKDGDNGYVAWDNSNGQGQYYGAVVGQVASGSTGYTITYSSDHYGKGMSNSYSEADYATTWAMPSTTIPQTPFNEKKPTPPTPPEKPSEPTPKTTEIHYHYNKLNVNSVPNILTTVHYHYDVSAGNCSCRTLLLQSSHSKFSNKKELLKKELVIAYSAFLSLLKSVSC